MSLINQALKKAQRDRNPSQIGRAGDNEASGGMQYAPGGEAKSWAEGLNFKIVIGAVVAFAALIGLVVGLTVVLLSNSPSGSLAADPRANEARGSLATSRTDPVSRARSQVDPGEPSGPEQVVTSERGASLMEELRRAREAAEARAKAEAEAAARPDPNQEVIEWLGAARISGVRMAGEASKVILNGEAYAPGETVNYRLNLTLLVIQEERLLFEDGKGVRYMKAL